MIKVQDILLKGFLLDGEKDMYYRAPTQLEQTEDGSVKLCSENYYDFFTFFNALSLKKLTKYTKASEFYLVIEAKGDFKVELFGHSGKNNNFQKEWLGVHTYKCNTRKKIILPLNPVFSEIVSYGIWCNSSTYIYSAWYGADINDNTPSVPFVNVISHLPEDKFEADKKKDFMYSGIIDDQEYKDKFGFVFCDEERRSQKEKTSKTPSYDLYIGDRYVSGNILIRLFHLLSILKEEYKKSFISGSIIDLSMPGMCIRENKNDYGIANASLSSYELEKASEIIENEDSESPFLTYLEKISFVCKPQNDKTEKNKEDIPVIRINGLCSYGENIKKAYYTSVNDNNNSSIYNLQDIVLNLEKSIEITKNMYYRSDTDIEKAEGDSALLLKDYHYDFFTYFNSFSLRKWKKYTHINNLYLVLEAKGSFDVEIFGHYKNTNGYQKEICGRHFFENKSSDTVILKFPGGMQSTIVGFSIYTYSDMVLQKAYYATDIDTALLKSPLISMVTTTFKKEAYVQKNIELLGDNLLADDDYKDHFIWNIIDNGRKFSLQEDVSDKIRLFPNKNVGGAGGFAKGMMISLTQQEKPDYILLMDDDVVFIPESFKRLYKLLSILKEEYKDYFISGAMLKMGQPNIQHEDTGKLLPDGYHVAVKPNYDLNLWNHIVDNEELYENISHQYGAWWFCCIPTTVASLDNLPLPVFVRGDDVEYSLRNNAKFITMNGLCIWHEGFEGKFSAALEFYQVNRNELAVRAVHPELNDVDCIGHIKTIFWEELYKFNYRGASLLLDAVEDYMKGPEFFKTLDGEKSMKKKRSIEPKMLPITPEIEAMVNYETLYNYETVLGKLKTVYDYTYNGQARIPEGLIKNKTGVIPYGWGYSPGKMCLTKQNIAIDRVNNTYTVYKKSRNSFNKLKERFERVMRKYDREHKKIEKKYQDSVKSLTSESFWEEYLR